MLVKMKNVETLLKEKIEALLTERKMSKAELARQIGVHRQNITGMLKNPTLESMQKIASALDVEVWQLFASPDDVCGNAPKNDFVAMVRFRGELYQAGSIDELEKLIAGWKADTTEN